MILKSMSRKEPSFGQLAAYMSDEKSDRDFDLHHNVFARDPRDIAAEFEANARLLGKRRGGNYLFHEILSIDTRACGQDREVKEKLRRLALKFIEERCPRSKVYGALHRDHAGHLHYHLMISANEMGDRKRQRLTPSQFNAKKRALEQYARDQYPELKQERVMDITREERDQRRAERAEMAQSREAQEMTKRGARLSKKEQLAQDLRSAMAYAGSQAEFERLIGEKGFAFYTRGKTVGVRAIEGEGGKKSRAHRFATLGIAQEYEAFLERLEPVLEEDTPEREEAEWEEAGPDPDARADARSEAAGEKEKEAERDVRDAEMDKDREAERAARDGDREEAAPERDPRDHDPAPDGAPAQEALSETQRQWKAQAEARRAERARSRERDGPDRDAPEREQ